MLKHVEISGWGRPPKLQKPPKMPSRSLLGTLRRPPGEATMTAQEAPGAPQEAPRRPPELQKLRLGAPRPIETFLFTNRTGLPGFFIRRGSKTLVFYGLPRFPSLFWTPRGPPRPNITRTCCRNHSSKTAGQKRTRTLARWPVLGS